VLDLAFYIKIRRGLINGVTFINSTVFSVLIKYQIVPFYSLDQLTDWLEFQFWLGQFVLAMSLA
jgi:hypothetical protein